jgi:hypothetical protein
VIGLDFQVVHGRSKRAHRPNRQNRLRELAIDANSNAKANLAKAALTSNTSRSNNSGIKSSVVVTQKVHNDKAADFTGDKSTVSGEDSEEDSEEDSGEDSAYVQCEYESSGDDEVFITNAEVSHSLKS